ncbi:hypothetical protein EG829_07240 [bacterium]|nr:hypothetical protein [bacterium]
MVRTVRLIGVLLLSLFVLGCGDDDNVVVLPSYGVGVVAFSGGWIGILDARTQTVSAPFLVGELGSFGGGTFDVVITPDRKTALLSNFGDSTVYFVDISNRTAPSVLGSVTLSFFAEDIALTPNGRYALVSDGGFSPRIAVLDVQNLTLVEEFVSPDLNPDPVITEQPLFNAVAVAADGQTVLAADYFGGKVNTLTIDATGHLTYVGVIDVSNGGTVRPVNISISPDGKTAIAACPANATAPAVPADNMRFPVLEISAPGVVTLKSFVVTGERITASQSIVFNSSGTKAYALCTQEDPDPADLILPPNMIVELDVAGPGAASVSGVTVPVDFIGTSQLFGVDTLALDRTNRYLYVSNQTQSGAKNQLVVVDVKTASVVKTLTFDDVMVPPVGGVLESAIPMGLYIR